jgi:hypothetical protein
MNIIYRLIGVLMVSIIGIETPVASDWFNSDSEFIFIPNCGPSEFWNNVSIQDEIYFSPKPQSYGSSNVGSEERKMSPADKQNDCCTLLFKGLYECLFG